MTRSSLTEYVVGFAFDSSRKFVVLIEKKHPKWQAGLFNGVGGHVEIAENAAKAMSREFKEETGVDISQNAWQPYATLVGVDYKVRVFRTFTDRVHEIKTMTDEWVSLQPVNQLGILPVIPNLLYLIPLALDDKQVGWPTFNYGWP